MGKANADSKKAKQNPEKKRVYVSILLALAALVSISAASVAWFTIADFTKVNSMNLEITTGTNLRFDLDPHETFEEYVKTLGFSQIAERILREKKFDMRTVPLEPVTTQNYSVFTFENGTVVEKDSGAYLEFVLHFMATDDMLVHLTSADSEGKQDGTRITSSNADLPAAMRISFTVDGQTYVYDPGMGDLRYESLKVKQFGLPASNKMVLNENNQLFWVEKDQDKPVTVRIWLEGTDPVCTDDLRNSDYKISLRFVGTDKDHNILDGSRKK